MTGRSDKSARKKKSRMAIAFEGLKIQYEKDKCRSYQKSATIKKVIKKFWKFANSKKKRKKS